MSCTAWTHLRAAHGPLLALFGCVFCNHGQVFSAGLAGTCNSCFMRRDKLTACCEHVTQMRQLEAAARAASESQAEATAVREAMSSEAKRAQASTYFACASV